VGAGAGAAQAARARATPTTQSGRKRRDIGNLPQDHRRDSLVLNYPQMTQRTQVGAEMQSPTWSLEGLARRALAPAGGICAICVIRG
jgi:hypothetical protein